MNFYFLRYFKSLRIVSIQFVISFNKKSNVGHGAVNKWKSVNRIDKIDNYVLFKIMACQKWRIEKLNELDHKL